MSWTCFQLDFAQQSDICIGFHKLGWVQRTRYFIPARNLWAAATALHARRATAPDYPAADVDASLRFTPLFLASDKGGTPWFPWEKETEFEAKFVSSRGRVAIDPAFATASDGALFDMEYLARTPGFHWLGYVWARAAWSKTDLRSLLDRIEVGGERRYGMGVLRMLDVAPAARIFGAQPGYPDAEDPQVSLGAGHRVPAHLLMEGCPADLTVSGQFEPLTGRNTVNAAKFGQAVAPMQPCWQPGAILSAPATLHVGSQGVWRFAPSR